MSRSSLAGEIAGRLGGSRSVAYVSPFAGSTLLPGLARADQPSNALALPGTESDRFVIHFERSR